MNTKIIVVPKSYKLAQTLSYHNKSLFNTKILTPIELAQEALIRSAKSCNLEFIDASEELTYYKKIIDSIDYFKTNKIADIKNINSTINTIRKLIVNNEKEEVANKLEKGIFLDKNKALIKVYEEYTNKLEIENKIDSIGLIRYAINNIDKLNIKVQTIKEYPLQPLERKLIDLFDNEEVSIFTLFGTNNNNIHIKEYRDCYGTSNEIAYTLDDIYKNNKGDQSVIALADYQTYSQVLFDYSLKNNIRITFDNGIKITNSYPGKLLKQYYDWKFDGNYGSKPFLQLIYSPYFNLSLLNEEIQNKDLSLDKISKIRFTDDNEINHARVDEFIKSISRKDMNDYDNLERDIPVIKALAKELSLPTEEFIKKYAIKREVKDLLELDESAIQIITNEFKTIRNIGLDISVDIFETIMNKYAYRKPSTPGYLHVVDIKDALMCLRQNLYVCGLSSLTYPGSPKENHLLLDADLENFNNSELTSNGKIKQKHADLINLLKLSSGLNNNIYLSYPGLDVSELKHNNASSMLYEIYRLENNNATLDEFKNNVKRIGYFEHGLSITNKLGLSYNKDQEIIKTTTELNINKTTLDINRYSPSALNTYFNCPKQFFYQYLLKIPQPDDYNPYEVISASDQGTLAHALMEYLPDHNMSKEEFLKLAEDVFDEHTKITVPLIQEKVKSAKEEFVEMLENGYDMDKRFNRELAFKEEDKDALHSESNLLIHGYPDRVELTKEHKAVIVDFKTERGRNNHLKDDVDTCLQVLIYAYIVEKTMNLEIDHAEYRMLRYKDGIITCKYDDEIKKALKEKLIQFKKALDSGDFDIEPMTKDEEKQRCKYCKYGSICHKEVKENE